MAATCGSLFSPASGSVVQWPPTARVAPQTGSSGVTSYMMPNPVNVRARPPAFPACLPTVNWTEGGARPGVFFCVFCRRPHRFDRPPLSPPCPCLPRSQLSQVTYRNPWAIAYVDSGFGKDSGLTEVALELAVGTGVFAGSTALGAAGISAPAGGYPPSSYANWALNDPQRRLFNQWQASVVQLTLFLSRRRALCVQSQAFDSSWRHPSVQGGNSQPIFPILSLSYIFLRGDMSAFGEAGRLAVALVQFLLSADAGAGPALRATDIHVERGRHQQCGRTRATRARTPAPRSAGDCRANAGRQFNVSSRPIPSLSPLSLLFRSAGTPAGAAAESPASPLKFYGDFLMAQPPQGLIAQALEDLKQVKFAPGAPEEWAFESYFAAPGSPASGYLPYAGSGDRVFSAWRNDQSDYSRTSNAQQIIAEAHDAALQLQQLSVTITSVQALQSSVQQLQGQARAPAAFPLVPCVYECSLARCLRAAAISRICRLRGAWPRAAPVFPSARVLRRLPSCRASSPKCSLLPRRTRAATALARTRRPAGWRSQRWCSRLWLQRSRRPQRASTSSFRSAAPAHPLQRRSTRPPLGRSASLGRTPCCPLLRMQVLLSSGTRYWWQHSQGLARQSGAPIPSRLLDG